MGTVTVSTTPVELDDGSNAKIYVGNTGQVRATLTIGSRTEVFDPGFSRGVDTGGVAVTAVTALGSTTLTVNTTNAAPDTTIDQAELQAAILDVGLGDAALLDVGTSAGTVAAGNDSRITGAAQKSANLSDLASAATARTNLGAAPLASPTFTGTVTIPAATGNGQPVQYQQAAPLVGSDEWLKLHAGGNLDALIVGAITRDSNGAATSATVAWPDGTGGTYTATTASTAFPGAVDAYTVTYAGSPTKTVTQPAVTRDATTGAVTTRPAMTVS